MSGLHKKNKMTEGGQDEQSKRHENSGKPVESVRG